MWKHIAKSFLLLTCLFVNTTKGANILALLPSPSSSHLIIEMAVVKELAVRNHNVTVVSVLPLKSEWLHPNMNYVHLDHGMFDMNAAINSTKKSGLSLLLKAVSMFKNIILSLAEILDDEKLLEIRNNPGNQYDLLLFGYIYGDFIFGLAEHFNCPVALLWPNVLISDILQLTGNPLELTHSVSTMMNLTSNTRGFLFRFRNLLSYVVDAAFRVIRERTSKEVYE
ncbi:UDP-glycosyltransferase UGT4-like [Musca autumnalis]|uniref:UDP-glycosyltransferase UGT4-like n=1 Tax=Musca autumnalis TaxID=221902 RepID=UPI003CEC41E4